MDNEIHTLLSHAFPDLTIKILTRMGSGKAGEIFLANNEIVFKVELASDTSHSELKLEYDVLRVLQGQLDIAIPQPFYFGVLSDGRKVLGMSFVPGVQFSQELYEEFSQAEKDALFMQMGEILCQLHSVSVPQNTIISECSTDESLSDFYNYYTDDVKNALSIAEQAQMQKIIDNFVTAIKASPVPMVLCHGDLHFWNLNYDPTTKKICGLLDFGIACYNDPLNEMRYFWSDTVTKILCGYRGNIGENIAARHLFYNVHNLVEEANAEIANGVSGLYVEMLKRAMFQEPL